MGGYVYGGYVCGGYVCSADPCAYDQSRITNLVCTLATMVV